MLRVCAQTNIEGELVEFIHYSRSLAGVVFNAGAYTHYSWALHDAIAAVPTPVVEIHIANLHAREAFRQHSCIGAVCQGTIQGAGIFVGHAYSVASLQIKLNRTLHAGLRVSSPIGDRKGRAKATGEPPSLIGVWSPETASLAWLYANILLHRWTCLDFYVSQLPNGLKILAPGLDSSLSMRLRDCGFWTGSRTREQFHRDPAPPAHRIE